MNTDEGQIRPPSEGDLRVFVSAEERPPGLNQDGVFRLLKERAEQTLQAHIPTDKTKLNQALDVYGPYWQQLFPPISSKPVETVRHEPPSFRLPETEMEVEVESMYLAGGGSGHPRSLCKPAEEAIERVTIVVHEDGKQALTIQPLLTHVERELRQNMPLSGSISSSRVSINHQGESPDSRTVLPTF